jgi:hypothetical protein
VRQHRREGGGGRRRAARVPRSASRPTNRPLSGAKASLTTANTLTTADAAATPTSKLRANVGSAGAAMP